MVMSALLKFLFPPPPSLVVSALSVVNLVSLTSGGLSEMRGKHMNYSKFWNATTANSAKQIKLSSRAAMLMLYTPAFLAGVASFFIFPNEGLRSTLLQSALTLHFFKRDLEVLFVHKYSGYMYLDSAIPITLSYFISAATMTYSQHLTVTEGLPQPQIDLMYPGVAVFLIGIIGNLYHHYLLSKLRGVGEKEYKIPKGGLFGLVICPHYLFEITMFYGISMISQTVYSLCFTIGTTFYLVGRSYATRKWYLSKFEDFPKNVKAVIPFVF
ncbi:steroid 5-alpha-reductase DET2-like [Arachis stenosperma]|uniref:steroid 5-alpha-reductase DET2-like n=1 Tax=Arachis stenosperma TaxID=217475 RepID=UPI0025AB91E2|nr:steroid 5-alpha-reductase DET2-like [Arachis stenosperma]